jgi:glutaminase
MCCSLIQAEMDRGDRFDYVTSAWRRLSGSDRIGFNNAVYLSERQTADRNFALGYSMRERKAFPAGTDLLDTLEFYFQCCAVEIDAESMSVVAASLANGGVAPLGGGHVFSTSTVQRCLSLMSSCGMYDYSGEFAFSIGLPAKSGVSGALMVVIPQVMGICVWSPRLDALGNSVRGIEFSRQLVSRYNFHAYDGLIDSANSGKRDPRLRKNQTALNDMIRLCWAASQGDLDEVRALIASGVDPNTSDYDGRTALHLAASEGHRDVVAYLLDHERRWSSAPPLF